MSVAPRHTKANAWSATVLLDDHDTRDTSIALFGQKQNWVRFAKIAKIAHAIFTIFGCLIFHIHLKVAAVSALFASMPFEAARLAGYRSRTFSSITHLWRGDRGWPRPSLPCGWFS